MLHIQDRFYLIKIFVQPIFNDINRFSGYAQWNQKTEIGSSQVWYNLGARFQSWSVSGASVDGKNQVVFSPRAQFAIKPDWGMDMIFRLSGGLYHQPPFLQGAS